MSKKLLIVDDEPHIRMLLEQTLEELEDYDVDLLIATNGQEALETIQSEKPDLVFLDVMMPKMNGYEVCQKVKSDDSLSDVYIIMLTAKGQEFDRSRGEDVGADVYMTKPFDPDEILEKSCEILRIEIK
ncbi:MULTISPECIES: response regulator transcription factor [Pseudanabaena]|uniref:Response regulator receiver protein n=2 Tax=Pseudanabaena TaxID=1152 RepID=L8MXK6_9CYAN|nr:MULTISPECIES: response regulator [Pseudanabaena]ELS32201.1 response regulator receiver protein [Pseudanabaena biceps PCC 7429]MDG3495540.1 response regulator [Pseudanabaena catenata USMAC16]TYQ30895.1 response regulator [Pseudanabaena sp. UWO310]